MVVFICSQDNSGAAKVNNLYLANFEITFVLAIFINSDESIKGHLVLKKSVDGDEIIVIP